MLEFLKQISQLNDRFYAFAAVVLIAGLYLGTREPRILELLVLGFGALFGILRNGGDQSFISTSDEEIKTIIKESFNK